MDGKSSYNWLVEHSDNPVEQARKEGSITPRAYVVGKIIEAQDYTYRDEYDKQKKAKKDVLKSIKDILAVFDHEENILGGNGIDEELREEVKSKIERTKRYCSRHCIISTLDSLKESV